MLNELMHTLSKVLSANCSAIITTPITDSAFSLSDLVETTRTTSQSVYEVTGVTCEMVTYFKRFGATMDCDPGTYLKHVAAPAR